MFWGKSSEQNSLSLHGSHILTRELQEISYIIGIQDLVLIVKDFENQANENHLKPLSKHTVWNIALTHFSFKQQIWR